MVRCLQVLSLVALLQITGCGQVFIGFVSNPQLSPSSVSGIVIVVHLGSTTGINPVTFTSVSFNNAGLSNTVNFCGDQQSQFHVNQSVRADYNAGSQCSTLVAVVVL
jgi:hypothetical protein